MDCGTNRTTLSWAETAGASYYVAEVTGEHGHVTYCVSNETSCLVRLHCGRTYNATLVAASGSCNSSLHDTIQFDSGKAQAINTLFNELTPSDIHTFSLVLLLSIYSKCHLLYFFAFHVGKALVQSVHVVIIIPSLPTAPCQPQNVVAELDCSNALLVTWQQNPGFDVYTVHAQGSDGYRASCNSSATSCTIQDLDCGQSYGVVVTTSLFNCSVFGESDYNVQSGRCCTLTGYATGPGCEE